MSTSRQVALGGMLTAVAVVIMNLGSAIPVNTYICPVLCLLINRIVLEKCGRRIGWCYYMATAVLSLLLAPDREAALVYAFLGYYPMIRPRFERLSRLKVAAKLVFFTLAGGAAFAVVILLMGAVAVMDEGWFLTAVTLLLWDVLFLLVDRLLGMPMRKR